MKISSTHALTAATLSATFVTPLAVAQEEPEGDGAPHVAVALDGTELELEFEVSAGLDLSGDTPVLTLDTSAFVPQAGGFTTFPTNSTPSPNDDLGFVSEVEGAAEEGGDLGTDIGVRLLARDSDFRVFLGSQELFTEAAPVFNLGSAFDTHPTWVLESNDPDLVATSTASFEVFAFDTGEVIGAFDVQLATVPEPASAALLAAGGALLLRRRRA